MSHTVPCLEKAKVELSIEMDRNEQDFYLFYILLWPIYCDSDIKSEHQPKRPHKTVKNYLHAKKTYLQSS